MTALHPSRRRVLATAATGIGALLAGCSQQRSTTVSEESSDRGAPPDGAITDPEHRTLRADTDEPFVYNRDDADQLDDNEADDEPPWIRPAEFVLSREQADGLVFELEPPGTEEVRAFLEKTDFEEESIVIDHRSVGECYEMVTEHIIAEPDRFRSQHCNVLKDVSVECDAEKEVMQATFIRIPHAYEDQPSSRGRGWSSTCDRPRGISADEEERP